MLDCQKLLGQRTTAQLAQLGELAQKPLSLLFEVWVIGRVLFHVVVYVLQYEGQKQAETPKPTFISSTPAGRKLDNVALPSYYSAPPCVRVWLNCAPPVLCRPVTETLSLLVGL